MAALTSTQTSTLIARCGLARSGTFRCGFAPKYVTSIGGYYGWQRDDFTGAERPLVWTVVREP